MGKNLKGKDIGRGFDQTKDGRYRGRFKVNGKSYDVYAATITECRDKLEARKQEVKNGINRDNKRINLEQFFDDVYFPEKKKSTKVSTLRIYKSDFDSLVRGSRLGKMQITDITADDVLIHINELVNKKSKSEKRVNRMLSFIYSIFDFAIELDIIAINPSKKKFKFKTNTDVSNEVDGIHRALSVEDVMKIYNAIDDFYKNLFEVEFCTGCRINELTALKWDDLDFVNDTISIKKTLTLDLNYDFVTQDPKSEKSKRQLKMIPKCKEALLKQKEMVISLFGGMTLYVFPSISNKFLSAQTYLNILERACEKAGLPRITSHALRSTNATILTNQKVPITIVSKVLGHSSIRMTEKYVHPSNEDVFSSMNMCASAFDIKEDIRIAK